MSGTPLAIRIRGLVDAEAAWRGLESRAALWGFSCFDWLSSWQQTLGAASGATPLVVIVGDDAPLLIWPLCHQRVRGMRVIRAMGGRVSDYQAPLIDPAFAATMDDAGWAALLARILAALPAADILDLARVPHYIGDLRNPLLELAGMRAAGIATQASLPADFAAFAAARSTSLFAHIRRQRRKLEKIGPVRYLVAETDADRSRMLAAMMAQKSRRWAETGDNDAFAEPAFAAFYRRLTERGIAQGAVHLSALMVGEEMIASHWGIIHRDRYYYLMVGWDGERWRPYSPGRLIIAEMVNAAIGLHLAVFDLTVGSEAYKRDWADSEMAMFALRRGISRRGRAMLAAENLAAGLRARAKRIGWLRAAVRRLRKRAEQTQ